MNQNNALFKVGLVLLLMFKTPDIEEMSRPKKTTINTCKGPYNILLRHLNICDQQKKITLNLQDWRKSLHYRLYTCNIVAVSINLYESGKGLTPIDICHCLAPMWFIHRWHPIVITGLLIFF